MSQVKKHRSNSNNLVWYVCYGSNLYRTRFMKYINGGSIAQAGHIHIGCRDKTPPLQEKAVTIPYQLYFSQYSHVWGGGVAFIDTQLDASQSTKGFAYLITQSQFADIVYQENLLHRARSFPFASIIRQRQTTLENLRMYNTVIRLEDIETIPALTFTASPKQPPRKPSIEYLQHIAAGIQQTYAMSPRDTARYLLTAPGVQESYALDELTDAISITPEASESVTSAEASYS